MNERRGKNGSDTAALHYELYQQITSSSDEADKAAQEMVVQSETLLEAVRQGTEQIRSELREKMVEFATLMRDYSETIAAKNRAYIESTRNTIDVISSHIETVRAAMKAVAPERATIAAGTRYRESDQRRSKINERH